MIELATHTAHVELQFVYQSEEWIKAEQFSFPLRLKFRNNKDGLEAEVVKLIKLFSEQR